MDETFIKKTFQLAKKGLSWTSPNPLVGALLVKSGQVIGAGYHQKYGFPHAEIEALKNCQDPKGATLYVNLEPCNHFGKTPPCTDEIIKRGVKKVVCATLDPNPKTFTQGVDKLKKAGLEMVVGLLEKEAKVLNEAFFTFYEKKRPFIALKFASSLDGKIATKSYDSKWITNERAREYARRLRGEYQAVLVGINTVLKDNPHLGTRIRGLKDPVRIILDPYLKIPLKAQVLRDDQVIIVTSSKAPLPKVKNFSKRSKVITLKGTKISIADLLDKLVELKIISVLAEGGSQTLGHFLDSGLFDKVYAFYAPILVGGEKSISAIGGEGVNFIKQATHLKDLTFHHFKDNLLIIGTKA